jgi:mannose-1-phosphate guanylyltransferase
VPTGSQPHHDVVDHEPAWGGRWSPRGAPTPRDASLRRTVERALRLIPSERLVVVTTRATAGPQETELQALAGVQRIVQPADRGTAPEVFLPVLRIARQDPHAIVVVLPSEHRVDQDARFMKYVANAVGAASERPDLPFVIGARPRAADPSCPWIEPGPPIEGLERFSVRSVRRFLPRPSVAEVDSLFVGQGLLNTQVLVAHARTLIGLGKHYVPEVLETLEPLEEAGEGPEADLLCDAVYECMPHASLADGLADGWRHFAVLPIPDAMWWRHSQPGVEALAS